MPTKTAYHFCNFLVVGDVRGSVSMTEAKNSTEVFKKLTFNTSMRFVMFPVLRIAEEVIQIKNVATKA